MKYFVRKSFLSYPYYYYVSINISKTGQSSHSSLKPPESPLSSRMVPFAKGITANIFCHFLRGYGIDLVINPVIFQLLKEPLSIVGDRSSCTYLIVTL